jgi:hypothetical protein
MTFTRNQHTKGGKEMKNEEVLGSFCRAGGYGGLDLQNSSGNSK